MNPHHIFHAGLLGRSPKKSCNPDKCTDCSSFAVLSRYCRNKPRVRVDLRHLSRERHKKIRCSGGHIPDRCRYSPGDILSYMESQMYSAFDEDRVGVVFGNENMINMASSTLYLENILSILPWKGKSAVGQNEAPLEVAVVYRRPQVYHLISQYNQNKITLGYKDTWDVWLCHRFTSHLFDLNVWEYVARMRHTKRFQKLLDNIDRIYVMDSAGVDEHKDISDILLCDVMRMSFCSKGMASEISGKQNRENRSRDPNHNSEKEKFLPLITKVQSLLQELHCSYQFMLKEDRVTILPSNYSGTFDGCPANVGTGYDPSSMKKFFTVIREAGCSAAGIPVPEDEVYIPEMQRAMPIDRELFRTDQDNLSPISSENLMNYPYYIKQGGNIYITQSVMRDANTTNSSITSVEEGNSLYEVLGEKGGNISITQSVMRDANTTDSSITSVERGNSLHEVLEEDIFDEVMITELQKYMQLALACFFILLCVIIQRMKLMRRKNGSTLRSIQPYKSN